MDDAERTFPLPTRRATQQLGARIARLLTVGDVVVLEGDLGSGKTFLARAIARGLGVAAGVPITSPTFGLVHELPARVPLLHADLHRLGDAAELLELGLPPERPSIVIVEWGARFRSRLRPTLEVRLAVRGAHARDATIVGVGVRGRALLAALAG